MISPEQLMQLAIAKAREGIAAGQSPFGCAVARGDDVLAVTHNLVLATTDITAHAEIVAIRAACWGTGRIHLVDCLVVSTCEPCPMCMSALHWSRVAQVYYGAAIADANAVGFNELKVAASDLLKLGDSSVQLIPGVLVAECRALFSEWARTPGHRAY
jgi:guanine deaminase